MNFWLNGEILGTEVARIKSRPEVEEYLAEKAKEYEEALQQPMPVRATSVVCSDLDSWLQELARARPTGASPLDSRISRVTGFLDEAQNVAYEISYSKYLGSEIKEETVALFHPLTEGEIREYLKTYEGRCVLMGQPLSGDSELDPQILQQFEEDLLLEAEKEKPAVFSMDFLFAPYKDD